MELKFRCRDLLAAAGKAKAAGARDEGLIFQHDLFFGLGNSQMAARLKLRMYPRGEGDEGWDNKAELISYQRADQGTARTSKYHISVTQEPRTLVAVLSQALGEPKALKKTRHLMMYKATRIHLDTVHSLGDATFVELETVITDQSESVAKAELYEVVALLGLTDVVEGAYVDLVGTLEH